MSARHHIDIGARVPFGNDASLAGKLEQLAWWQARPALAKSGHSKQRIAILTRDIGQMQTRG